MKKIITLSAMLVIAVLAHKTKSNAASGSCFFLQPDTVVAYVPPADGIARSYTAVVNPHPDTIRLSDGIKYILIAKGNGPALECGDKASVIYTGRLMNDTLFDATTLHGKNPYGFQLCTGRVIAGWDSVIKYLHGGDVAEMFLPSKYGYGARQMGKIPANAPLKFLIEIAGVSKKPKQWDAKGMDTITTKSGLKIVMFEKHRKAAKATTGATVSVDYSGFLMNGTMFDSSIPKGQPLSFKLGAGRVIAGWEEGIATMHVGEKAKFIIPPSLGYGAAGYGSLIPANATLIFDVTLVDVK